MPVRDKTLATELVLAERFLVAFPVHHRLAAWDHVPVGELADEPHVAFSRSRAPAFIDAVARLCRDGKFTLTVRQEVDHPQTMLSLVAAGMGIALVPESARAINPPGVDYRPLRPAGPPLETAVAWRRRDRSALVGAFLEVVREVTDAGAARRSR